MRDFNLAEEIRKKNERIRAFIDIKGLDAVILGRQDNFSWYSCGGTSKVLLSSQDGCCAIVVTKNKTYLIAYTMDILRIAEEELAGANFIEYLTLKWYEESPFEKARDIVNGGKVLSDIPLENVIYDVDSIYRLYFPLCDWEMERLRYVGRFVDQLFDTVTSQLRPEMLDYDVQSIIVGECARHDAFPEVILVGSDERIAKYRHCIPVGRKLGKAVLIHPAVRLFGLHANVARMVYFGDKIPEELEKRHEATNIIYGTAAMLSRKGMQFAEIHSQIKQMYIETGYPEDWEKHFTGGASGYMIVDTNVCNDPSATVSEKHSFDWFITITGTKTEELVICDCGPEIVSMSGLWPSKEYNIHGYKFNLPEIKLL